MNKQLLAGLGAGVASAVVLITAATGGTMFALFTFIFLAPLPIVITGLGWGWASGALAAVVAALVMAGLLQFKAAVLHLVAVGAPMAIFAYYLMLNREVQSPDNSQAPAIEWYPIGRILGIAAIIGGALGSAALLSVATSVEGLETEIRKVVDRIVSGELPFPDQNLRKPTEEELEAFVKLMTASFSAAFATFWMMLACFNLWLGGLITSASGRLARPWPDLSLMALPTHTPLLFVGAIGLSFLPGYPGLIASGFASAFFFAYLVVGLAIVHNLTRGIAVRPLLLVMVYFSLVFLNPFSSIIVAMLAIAEPISPFRRRPPNPGAGNT